MSKKKKPVPQKAGTPPTKRPFVPTRKGSKSSAPVQPSTLPQVSVEPDEQDQTPVVGSARPSKGKSGKTNSPFGGKY